LISRRDRIKDLANRGEEEQRQVSDEDGREKTSAWKTWEKENSHSELDFSQRTGSNWISPRRVSSIKAFGSVELKGDEPESRA